MMLSTGKNGFLQRVNLGVRRGVAQALAQHKKAGRSIVVWQAGKIVKIPPEEIKLDESLLQGNN